MSQFTVFITPTAWREIKDLPGHVRQRARKAIDGLAEQPRPHRSKQLDIAGVAVEARRIRLDRWRIVYVVDEEETAIDVLAVRQRPPYDYGDLQALLQGYKDR